MYERNFICRLSASLLGGVSISYSRGSKYFGLIIFELKESGKYIKSGFELVCQKQQKEKRLKVYNGVEH